MSPARKRKRLTDRKYAGLVTPPPSGTKPWNHGTNPAGRRSRLRGLRRTYGPVAHFALFE